MSMSGKWKINVDTAVLANGDSIAAYLTSAGGALITSETIGGNEYAHSKGPESHIDGSAYAAASDYLSSIGVVDDNGNWVPFTLNAAGELPVSATVNFAGDYAEDTAHVSGDVGLFQLAVRRDARDSGVDTDGDYASFNVNANGELYTYDQDGLAQLVAANSSLDAIEASVASIDVDTSSIITELQAANTSLDAIESDVDAIRVEQADQGVTLDAILADTATIDTNVAALLLEVQNLSFAEDAPHTTGDMGIQALAVRKDSSGSNAANGDYTSFQTWSEGSLKVVDNANASMLQQQVSVANTATLLPATPLANRRSILIQNTGSVSFWVGSATVTASGATAGIEVPKGGHIELECGPAVSVYGITASGTCNANVLECA